MTSSLIALLSIGTVLGAQTPDAEPVRLAISGLLSAEAGLEERIHLVRGDAAHLYYPDGHFGCVAIMDVLHHLDDPVPVLREMVRVLDVDGIAIVAEFDDG